MAVVKNVVQITGDTSNMTIEARNLTGPDQMLFKWGSFKGSAEESRISVISIGIGTKVLNLRLKWSSLLFNRTTVTGTLLPRGLVEPEHAQL